MGTMKGVIIGRCPTAQLIDITHQIEPFSLYAGAYAIAQAAPYFPAGSLHVVVIDPGVGSARKPLLIEASGQLFIAPDNGVLSLILARDRDARVREISDRDLWLPSPSSTFHGRDVFAPVAGSLASRQIATADVGPMFHQPAILADLDPVKAEEFRWRGVVLSVDHFGNVITNFASVDFRGALVGGFALKAGLGVVSETRETFSGSNPGMCFVYSGSSGYLELGINQASAAETLAVRPGDSLTLEFAC